jgi:hypothetical protein
MLAGDGVCEQAEYAAVGGRDASFGPREKSQFRSDSSARSGRGQVAGAA